MRNKAIQDFFNQHMLTNIDLVMAKNLNMTRGQAGRVAKNKNKRLLSKLKTEGNLGVSLMITSTKHEMVRNPMLTGPQAENLAIKKNDLLIARLQNSVCGMYGKKMSIVEEIDGGQTREIFSRDISFEKSEVLVLLALFDYKNKELNIKDLSEIATAFSCRLGQRSNHASRIIRSAIKALNKGHKVYFKVEQKKEKKVKKETAIQRIHKELRRLVGQKVINNDQRKLLVTMINAIIMKEDQQGLGYKLTRNMLGKHQNTVFSHINNIKSAWCALT